MRSFLFLLVVPLIFAGTALPAVAQTNTLRGNNVERSLLWRISGNGLERPSYLFGTMHVEHKDVFSFGDSVLIALQACDAFANETHLDSFAVAYMRWVLEKANDTDAVVTAMQYISPVMFGSDMRSNSADTTEDGPIFLDAWLYRIARDLGKRTLGVESVASYIRMASGVEQEDAYLDNDTNYGYGAFASGMRLQRDLLRYYRSGNVDRLEELIRTSIPSAHFRKLITQRNRRMLQRIQEYAPQWPTFVAVGAGHLGGPEGLISLLRENGYTVTPVAAGDGNAFQNFVPPASRVTWIPINSAEGGFSATVPFDTVVILQNQPSSYNHKQVWIGSDMGHASIFWVGYMDIGLRGSFLIDEQQLMDAYLKRYYDDVAERHVQIDTLVFGGVPGREMVIRYSRQNGLRLRLISRGHRIYTMMIRSPVSELFADNATKFFASFKLTPSHTTEWLQYSNDTAAFRVEMPTDPVISSERPVIPTTRNQLRFVAHDIHSRGMYVVEVTTFSEYYQAPDRDTLFLDKVASWMGEEDRIVRNVPITIDGIEGRDVLVEATLQGEGMRMRMLLRGNRLYSVVAPIAKFGADTASIERFITSFHLLPAEAESDLFSSKLDRILADIADADTLVAKNAQLAIMLSNPDSSSLPQIFARITELAPKREPETEDDISHSTEARNLLLQIIARSSEPEAVRFVRDLYNRTSAEALLRPLILELLANIASDSSITTLVDLMIASHATGRLPDVDIYSIERRLRTVGRLLPRIIPIAQNDYFRDQVIYLAAQAIDSGFVDTAALAPVVHTLVEYARSLLVERRASSGTAFNQMLSKEPLFTEENSWVLNAAIRLVGHLDSTHEASLLLRSILEQNDYHLILAAALVLLERGDAVDKATIARLAADPAGRVLLYRQMVLSGEDHRFPEFYRTQRAFAESLLAEWLQAYGTPPTQMRYVAIREVEKDGVTGRYFLFKFMMDTEWYVGISGPQPFVSEDIATTAPRVGSLYEEYSSRSIREHFENLLERFP